jgi:hypothetical protein
MHTELSAKHEYYLLGLQGTERPAGSAAADHAPSKAQFRHNKTPAEHTPSVGPFWLQTKHNELACAFKRLLSLVSCIRSTLAAMSALHGSSLDSSLEPVSLHDMQRFAQCASSSLSVAACWTRMRKLTLMCRKLSWQCMEVDLRWVMLIRPWLNGGPPRSHTLI